MLVNALVCVALIALAATTILSAGLVTTRVSVHRLAQTYLSQGYQRAVDTLETNIAAYAQAGSIPSPLPTFTPLPPLCADANPPCAFTSTATITLSRGNATASNQEANAYVAEDRLAAHISVAVRAPDGTLLATRDNDLTLRTMLSPPYVAIAGARDATFDDVAFGNLVGDDGGKPPATANPCAAGAAGSSDDTVVRVAYKNAQTGACTDGSSWR
ncbi:MAG TPA: hypothetical protein VFO29_06000 [Candidatus Rubrimentiphilum sp.]|nr:hypothetical protein [Candidatus Rubrimentiphilum sp.]